MGAKITVVSSSKKVSGNNCKIGGYYRRESEPNKVYICSRDTTRDRHSSVNQVVGRHLVHEGRMLVSLAHGNRMTANMDVVDFIEVDVVITATDRLE
ncbi:hypothetical protein D305_gp16 [Pseudomonas phage UFV-P2]|uniref:Uncharacterized protein n=1 Tax=Pseudomonas phage UFV-P2 TaxID=1235661 RepID=M4T665_9CAUD|nr:hypothetical protein D305_gp16 [Pseudomonas phage UFV-P2]AGH62710.1 hypothetical protein [Pseudomonas phage UFV-P2]